MPGKGNSYQALAKQAAERVDQQRELGQQLTFLPDEAEGSGEQPGRGKGRALNQMREFLARNGCKMPEEVLVQMAGLASRDDAMTTAISATERLLAHAFADATDDDGKARRFTPEQFLHQFQMIYTIQLRALDALMPYGTPKATPDAGSGPVIQINVPAAPQSAQPVDVTPKSPKSAGRMMPADVAYRMQQNQQVSEGEPEHSDGESRTDGASD